VCGSVEASGKSGKNNSISEDSGETGSVSRRANKCIDHDDVVEATGDSASVEIPILTAHDDVLTRTHVNSMEAHESMSENRSKRAFKLEKYY